jgi:hypothetical protein
LGYAVRLPLCGKRTAYPNLLFANKSLLRWRGPRILNLEIIFLCCEATQKK